MPQSQINSLIATVSGIFGGLGKALTANFILISVTFQGILQVSFYAAISALVGYGVKAGIDKLIHFEYSCLNGHPVLFYTDTQS
jgi:hypothetical protein